MYGSTSVSFAVSKAKDIVGGIPRTKEKGLDIVALGGVAGNSDLGLEVLNYVTEDDEKKALDMIHEGNVDVQVDWSRIGMGLYIDAKVKTKE